ncbi:MAG: branched-chain amino acid ABC transporter permease [Deltaproteobacteria bacterium CG11_big_fil_rev_8_21_14_0_20_47_16]|nr:MAG: branched-chain amino acid ABC transporter permease [Deltaproteobacteria bacterium CG11_big_fil_rev_8_21_14_0_20_47_16]
MEIFLQQLVNGISWGSVYALIAIGYTMVYGVLKLINFAHGDVYMIGAMTGYYVALTLGVTESHPLWHLGVVILGAMVVCALLGVAIEKIAYKPLRKAPRITALITAIGVSFFLEYAGQLIFGADPKFFPQLIESRPLFHIGDVAITTIPAIIVVVSLILMGILRHIVMHTNVGRAMRAVAFSPDAAQMVGVPVDRIISITFIIGSALAGAAGVLVGLNTPKIDPLMGIMAGLKAFVAAVIGGIGNVPGALIGGFFIGISESMVSGYLSSTYRDAFSFLLLIIILLVRPEGLLGKRSVEKV